MQRLSAVVYALALTSGVQAAERSITFEQNYGQFDAQIRWIARSPDYTLLLTGQDATMMLRGENASEHFRMKLGGNSRSWTSSKGLEPTGGASNYFLSDDPKTWKTDIPHYRRVTHANVYDGIDLVFYSSGGELEYDLVVAPYADPKQIRLAYDGIDEIHIESSTGDLLFTTAGGAEVRQRRPRVFQELGGQKVEVAGVYEILDHRRVAINLAFYDAGRELVIDPQLVYSTYLGGSQHDSVAESDGTLPGLVPIGSGALAVDSAGFAYVAGSTASVDFPAKSRIYPPRGGDDVFVSKFAPDGKSLVYSTYIGGALRDWANGIAVDSEGSAYITGYTDSANFPTKTHFQANQGGTDAFVVKLTSAGNQLVYSTYLGGTRDDYGNGIALDAAGSAYVVGRTLSTNYPLKSPLQTDQKGEDAFLTKLTPAGNALVYSTYLGGNDTDLARAVAVDAAGSAFVTGVTLSSNFPVKSAFQRTGGNDAFVTKFNPAGNALVYSTFLGGSGWDAGNSIAVDAAGAAYVAGTTASFDFPTKNPVQPINLLPDAFVTKLTPAGNALTYSTSLGGSYTDYGAAVAVDNSGAAVIVGATFSKDFPTHRAIQATRNPGDAFIARLLESGRGLSFSTYLGGSGFDMATAVALDTNGDATVAGVTSSFNFPTRSAFQKHSKDFFDAFLAKIHF